MPESAPADVIMVIRHGEKPTKESETGFHDDGTSDRNALTARGWQRAGALASLFDPPPGVPLRGVRRPDRIYATKKSDSGAHLRERQTVAALADKLGLPVHHHHPVAAIEELAAEIAPFAGATLVCWEHKALPRIVEGLGLVRPTPPKVWPSERFDLVWVFTRTDEGWSFAQVPQLLLAGDSANPAD